MNNESIGSTASPCECASQLGAEPPKRITPVEERIESLHGLGKDLESAINNLYDNLRPVLVEAQPRCGIAIDDENACPLNKTLDSMIQFGLEQVDKIRDINERIQL